MKSLISILTLTVLLASTAGFAADRVLLGERHVNDAGERDTIDVGADRGRFRGLQVQVSGSAVEFKRIVIHFENGDEQVLEKNRVLGKGDQSRVLDLNGGTRLIDKVVFHYEARSRGWKGANLKLYGVRP